jgi:acetyl-CoA/propionyl-CoA carboxylase biotin carboxyl carrier protein
VTTSGAAASPEHALFSKLLVANRGEIAVRVIRACEALGIRTVAVHSDVDAGALHVRLADEAVSLGGRTPAESYLNAEAILAAVKASGAEAVHPGYGFLSEQADFSAAVGSLGVAFVGPPAPAIEIMGDKLSARAAAAAAGVAGVPGTNDPLAGPDEVVAFGDEHGWPVAIKAAYGGGGRGLRVVRSAAEAAEALAAAQSEAQGAFGRPECYVERYLEWPHHVEIQVLADQHGHCVWLGDRDCSAQRRHQKLVEEAPAPVLTEEIRRAMGEAAVAVARGCGYVNAGTVEFLYEDGAFYFLEMNTRLQVEHPVTEMTTTFVRGPHPGGLDLVALQIRVAAGEPLPFTQADVDGTRRGHAIECRINAEDPAGGRFLPAPGTISALEVPDGPGIRWDGGYEAGDEVSPFYDNLVGKLVAWGEDRPAAIVRMLAALERFHLEGVATTIPAHLAILRHSDFVTGRHSTRWVEERLTIPEGDPDADPREVRVAGRWYSVPRMEGGMFLGGPPRRRIGSGAGGAADVAPGELVSPMQGTVQRLLVAVGDTVEAGQTVCVLEAMKMESALTARGAGTVTEIRVDVGQAVKTGEVLVVVDQ